MNETNNDYAKVDKAFAVSPIFSASGPNTPKPLRFQQRTDTWSIDYTSPRHCSMREQSLLLGLLAKTGRGLGRPLSRFSTRGVPSALWTRATGNPACEGGTVLPEVVAIEISGRELIQMAGLRSDGAENYAALKSWLVGLSDVAILDYYGFGKATQQLLAYREIENGYRIALCPRLSAAAMGRGGNVTVQLDERAGIPSVAGKLLHAKVSGNLHAGAWYEIGKDKLAGAIWPDHKTGPYPANWKATLSSALGELVNVGWQVSVKNGKAKIERPAKEGRSKPQPTQNIVEP